LQVPRSQCPGGKLVMEANNAQDVPCSAAEGSPRLLLVDDDDLMLAGLVRFLTASGYEVSRARCGADAVRLLAEQTFDVMLSDVHLGDTDGLQLLRSAHEQDPDLQVLLMTAAADIWSAAGAVEHGAFRYLLKPVDCEQLVDSLATAVAAGRCTRAEREAFDALASGNYRIPDRSLADAKLNSGLASAWMAYQPIVRAGSQRTFAHEALLRSDEPGLAEPRQLLSAAKRLNRLQDIGRAVRALVSGEMDRASPQLVFVNVHVEELLDSELVSPAAALSQHAPRVVLELTERSGMEDVPRLAETVAELRRLGFRFAIDDVGGGYAGLNALALLEPDFVKIDSSLVRDAHLEPVKRRLMLTIIDVCHSMGKLVVAEGVETYAERVTMESLGCDFLQGYLFGKPERGLPAASADSERA
jgi:EAL domain-containing protein (putative c-di-GMP-specific phosphodiesterase class I)/ActR/RegA family two-component response regulator